MTKIPKLRQAIEIEIERVQLDHATLEMATEAILSLFSSTLKRAIPKVGLHERGHTIVWRKGFRQALKDFTDNLKREGIKI
jgi:hypothetical protein